MSKGRARRWLWGLPGLVVGLHVYIVRELFAALILFTALFGMVAGLALFILLVQEAGQRGLAGAEKGSLALAVLARRQFAVLGELCKSHLAVHVGSGRSQGAGLTGQ